MAEEPNVVFILADQLRAASLPIHGEMQIETPRMRSWRMPWRNGWPS
jgi:hypothetical protein